jgi:hypothetical protein
MSTETPAFAGVLDAADDFSFGKIMPRRELAGFLQRARHCMTTGNVDRTGIAW